MFIIQLLMFFWSLIQPQFVYGQQSRFPEFEGNIGVRTPYIDSFCPRLEGAHLDHCCPALAKKTPIKCYYYVQASKPTYYESSYTVCKDPDNRVEETVRCCAQSSRPCDRDIVEKSFIQRLIKRQYQGNMTCGFEYCPGTDYWLNPPPPYSPDPNLTVNHRLAGKNRPTDSCQEDPADNQCSESVRGVICQSSTYCPAPPTTSPPITSPPSTISPPTTSPPTTSPPTTSPPTTQAPPDKPPEG